VGAPRGVVNRNGPPEGGRPEGAGARAHAAITPRLFFSFFFGKLVPGVYFARAVLLLRSFKTV
jgi:hypothetical protein